MTTQRLVLLFALVAVLGGCSIWYMKFILPNTVVGDDVALTIPATTTPTPVAADPEPTKVPTKAPAVTTSTGAAALPVAVGVLDSDIDAIAASTIDSYDDSALEAQITSSEPVSLTTSYGI